MAHYVYIIYSPTINKYYTGETGDFLTRLQQHNQHLFEGSYTTQATDWEEFLLIECIDIMHARKLEAFIKKMKSRKFIESLKSDIGKLNDIIAMLAEGHSPDTSGRTL